MAKPEGYTFEVTVRGKKVWQATKPVIIGGIDTRVTGRGATPHEAWKRLEKNYIKRLVKFGEAPPSLLRTIDDGEVITVEGWLSQWFDAVKNKKVSPNARFRQQGLMKNHIFPHIGSKRLRELNSDHINTLIYTTLPNLKNPDGTRRLGSSPIRGVYYILKPALELALKKGRIGYDLMADVEAPDKDKAKNERIADKIHIPMKLIASTRKHDDAAYWVLAFYGLRQSERLGLEWSSFINLDKTDGTAALIIDRQLYNNAEVGRLELKMEPKSEAGVRMFPLPEDVRKAFVAHRHRQDKLRTSPGWKPTSEFKDLCFLSPTGDPIRHNADNRAWQALLRQNHIQPMRQHAMRHITATMLAEAGIPAEVAKSLLGHSSTAMTSYYTHIGLRAQLPAVNAISNAVSETLQDFINSHSSS
jgi:integrase